MYISIKIYFFIISLMLFFIHIEAEKQEKVIPCEIDFDCPEKMVCRLFCKKTCKTRCIKLPPRPRKQRPGFFYSETPFEWAKEIQKDEPLATPLTISEEELEQELKIHSQQLPPAIGAPEAPKPSTPPTLPPPDKPENSAPKESTTTPTTRFTEASETIKTMPPSLRPLPPGFGEHETGYGQNEGAENGKATNAISRPTTIAPKIIPSGYDNSNENVKSKPSLQIVPSGYDNTGENSGTKSEAKEQKVKNDHPIEPSGYEAGNAAVEAASTSSSPTTKSASPGEHEVPSAGVNKSPSGSSQTGYEAPSAGVDSAQNEGYDLPSAGVNKPSSEPLPTGYEQPSAGVDRAQNGGYEGESAAVEKLETSEIPTTARTTTHIQESYENPSAGINKQSPGVYENPSAGVDKSSSAQPPSYETPGISPNRSSSSPSFTNEGVDMPVLTQSLSGYESPSEAVIRPSPSLPETPSPNAYEAPSAAVIRPPSNPQSSASGYESPSAAVIQPSPSLPETPSPNTYEAPSAAVIRPPSNPQISSSGYESPSAAVIRPSTSLPETPSSNAYEVPSAAVIRPPSNPQISPSGYESPSAAVIRPSEFPSSNVYKVLITGVNKPESNGYEDQNAAVEASQNTTIILNTTTDSTTPESSGDENLHEGTNKPQETENAEVKTSSTTQQKSSTTAVEQSKTTEQVITESPAETTEKAPHPAENEEVYQGVEKAEESTIQTTEPPSTTTSESTTTEEETEEPFETFPYDVFPSPKPEPPTVLPTQISTNEAQEPTTTLPTGTEEHDKETEVTIAMLMASRRISVMETTQEPKVEKMDATNTIENAENQTHCPPPPICDKNCGIAMDDDGCQTCHCLWLSISCEEDDDCNQEGQFCDLGRCNCIDGYIADIHQSGVCIPDQDFKGPCSTDNQCPAGLYCIQGDCWQLPGKPLRHIQGQLDSHPESFPIIKDEEVDLSLSRTKATQKPSRTTSASRVIDSFETNEFPSEPKEKIEGKPPPSVRRLSKNNEEDEEEEAYPPAPPPQLNLPDYEAEIFGRFLTTAKPEFFTRMIEIPSYEEVTKKPSSSGAIKMKLKKTRGPKRNTYGSRNLFQLPDVMSLKNPSQKNSDFPTPKPLKVDSEVGEEPINYEDYGTYPVENREEISASHLRNQGKNPQRPKNLQKDSKKSIVSPEGWKPMNPEAVQQPYSFKFPPKKENQKIFLDYSSRNRMYKPIRVESKGAREFIHDECQSDRDCGPRYVCCEKKWCDLSNDCGRGKFCLPDCRLTKMTNLGRTNGDGHPLIDLVYD